MTTSPSTSGAPRNGRRRSTKLAFGAGAGVLGLLLAACGSSTSSSAKSGSSGTATVTTVSLWESHAGGPVANAQAALVKKFNATHQNVRITLNINHASTKALAALTAGKPPSFVELSHYDGKYLQAHALANLDPLIHGSNGISASTLSQWYPGVLANGQYQGAQYRLMADVKVSELFYNKSLFAKAGITSTPATWAQLGADLPKLAALGVTPLAFKDASAHIEPAFLSNGGSLFAPGSNQKKINYANAAGTTTFDYFKNLYSKKLMIFAHGNTIRADLANGKLAIGDGTSAGYVKVLQAVNGHFPLGVLPYPAGTSGHSANISQGLGFTIFTAASAAQKAAAFDFVKWFDAGPQMAYWAKSTGFAPVTKAAVPIIGSPYLSSHPGLAVSINELASKYTVPRATPDSYAEVESALDTAFYNAVTGKDTVAHALAQLDTKGNGYLAGSSGI